VLLNIERARILMAEQGLDALVATSTENVIYASDYTSWTLDTFKDLEIYAVIPRDGDIALIVSIDGSDYLAGRAAATSRIYTYGTYHIMRDPDAVLTGAEARLLEIRDQSSHHDTALAALTQALDDQALLTGTIGVDERGLSPHQWRALVETLRSSSIQPANDLFRAIRMIKTEEEIARLRYAVYTVEAGIQAAFQKAAPGVTEKDLQQIFRATVAATGTNPGHFETSAGTRSAASFPASEYRIQMGDVIRSDCGGRYLGYWADTGRTMVVGDPPPKLAHYYDALQAGIAAILAAIHPGVPVRRLFEAGIQTVRGAGIPHYQRHHVGHSIGLEMYEAPLLVATPGDTQLEPGMVINIELPYYELGLGGLQIEETVVVTESGYEILTTASRDMRQYNSSQHVDGSTVEVSRLGQLGERNT
jgi:Xaa-Pro dipeptidase